MRPRRPTRLPGFSYVGIHRYALRFATHARHRLFADAAVAEAARWQIVRTSELEGFALLAYCFMPDHVHLVVEGVHETSDLKHFAKLAKQRVTFALQTQHGIAAVWQEGYYERVLRSDEATDIVVRYVLENPVRAGLVRLAEEYPHSGALYWPEAT